MKWNKVGINEYDVLAVFVAIIFSPLLVFIAIREESAFIFAITIFYVLFILAMASIIILFGIRKSIALKGKKSTGVIKDKERTRNGYLLCIEYINEWNEKKEFYQGVENDTYIKMMVGMIVPIYVNKQYAAFREEELTKMKKESFVEVKKLIPCSYCDMEYDEKYNQCPYCGAIKL
jgi:hypothetical protein